MTTPSRLCARCKQTIDPERVEAVPETRLCPKCAGEVKEFRYTATTRGMNKAGSLKITGVDVEGVSAERLDVPEKE